MIDIVYKSKNVVIINKPVGIPSQSDPTGDVDAMTLTARALADMGENASLWLVHRLDRVVGGLIAFARNQRAAADISRLIAGGKLIKEYLAVAEGELSGEGEMRDFIYKDARLSKAFTVAKGRAGVKEAVLNYKSLSVVQSENGAHSLLKICLVTGRYHQIRVQLASRSKSIVGDGKYGSRDKGTSTPALFSHRLAFTLGNEKIDVSENPDKSLYPWNLWSEFL
jgi:23S rRNA pseudouridine1911/1915/1917 synthase